MVACKPRAEVSVSKEHHAAADFSNSRVLVGGRPVNLTPIEHQLLYQLTKNARNIVSQRTLLGRIWGLCQPLSSGRFASGHDAVPIWQDHSAYFLEARRREPIRVFSFGVRLARIVNVEVNEVLAPGLCFCRLGFGYGPRPALVI